MDIRHGVCGKQGTQRIVVKQAAQLFQVAVAAAIDPDAVIVPQFFQDAGVPDLFQIGIHLFVQVFLNFFGIRRAGCGAVELFIQCPQHTAQAERMAHQHQQQGQQRKKCKHQPVILSDFNFRFSTAYSTAAAATAYPAINGVR